MNWSRREIRMRNGRVLPPPSPKSKKLAIEFLEWLRSQKVYSDNTLHRYLIDFRKIISWCEMWDKNIYNLTYEDWLKIIEEIPGTDRIHVIVKLILKWLYYKTEDEKYMKIYQKIRVPRPKLPSPDILSEEQVQRLIEACSKIDFELKVLVEVIYETGARAGEILSLTRKDIEFDEYGAKIYIRKSKSEFYETCGRETEVTVTINGKDLKFTMKPFEIKTILLDPKDYSFKEVNLLEE